MDWIASSALNLKTLSPLRPLRSPRETCPSTTARRRREIFNTEDAEECVEDRRSYFAAKTSVLHLRYKWIICDKHMLIFPFSFDMNLLRSEISSLRSKSLVRIWVSLRTMLHRFSMGGRDKRVPPVSYPSYNQVCTISSGMGGHHAPIHFSATRRGGAGTSRAKRSSRVGAFE